MNEGAEYGDTEMGERSVQVIEPATEVADVKSIYRQMVWKHTHLKLSSEDSFQPVFMDMTMHMIPAKAQFAQKPSSEVK